MLVALNAANISDRAISSMSHLSIEVINQDGNFASFQHYVYFTLHNNLCENIRVWILKLSCFRSGVLTFVFHSFVYGPSKVYVLQLMESISKIQEFSILITNADNATMQYTDTYFGGLLRCLWIIGRRSRTNE